MRIADKVFLFNKSVLPVFNKSVLPVTLRTLRENPFPLLGDDDQYSLFSLQELMVMEYWMKEMPTYRIARKLQISSHTVYVHKRISQKKLTPEIGWSSTRCITYYVISIHQAHRKNQCRSLY